jgi:hypothetical protein
MTPVETLRTAARLMRERAEAATPGPWSSFFGRVRLDDGRDLFLTTTAGGYADAAHIASWHPAVALAVADWLDIAAGHQEVYEQEACGSPFLFGAALPVAHAYLGDRS